MSNSEKFIKAYNSIDNYLRHKFAKKDNRLSFPALVDLGARNMPEFRRFQDDLKEFAQLRNAIVHNYKNYIIAEPHDKVVEEIDRMKTIILNPPKLIPLFRTNIFTLKTTSKIIDAV